MRSSETRWVPAYILPRSISLTNCPTILTIRTETLSALSIHVKTTKLLLQAGTSHDAVKLRLLVPGSNSNSGTIGMRGKELRDDLWFVIVGRKV